MPRPPAGRTALDQAAVVHAAAALVDAEGAEALNINRLARDLGVQPPSLYNHVAGMPGLRRALALLNARQLGEVFAEAAVGRSGAEGVMAVAQAYRAYIKTHAGLYQSSLVASGNLSQPDPELAAAEERPVRVTLAVIESFGLRGDDAIHAVRGLRSLVHGFATLEAAGGFGLPLDVDESFNRLVEMFIRGMREK